MLRIFPSDVYGNGQSIRLSKPDQLKQTRGPLMGVHDYPPVTTEPGPGGEGDHEEG
jgi:hypothetical protein